MNQGAPAPTAGASRRRQVRFILEALVVFVVFALQGPPSVPDSNEPHYLAKARHYWDPSWLEGDAFLDTADTHLTFYLAWGWLTRFLSLEQVAWTGRVVTWGLLAVGWTRLCGRLAPRPGVAPAAALLFVALSEKLEMAGEWMIGGVEAKGFAFALVLWGLGSLVRGKWNAAWLEFGAASAFHVLVGGWSVIAAAVAWLAVGRRQTPLVSMWPGLLGGALLSLPGVLPSLELSRGIAADEAARANAIQVYNRLPHHLYLPSFKQQGIEQHLMGVGLWAMLLAVAWLASNRRKGVSLPQSSNLRGRALGSRGWRFQGFVAGSLAISGAGAALAGYVWFTARPSSDAPGLDAVPYSTWGTSLLRFYWFRLGDILLPMGLSLLAARMACGWVGRQRNYAAPLVCMALVGMTHLGFKAAAWNDPPRAYLERNRESFDDWRDACRWVSENTPRDARFLTPRMATTFRWYADRAEVANFKDMPQDAKSLILWWNKVVDLHYEADYEDFRWSLGERPPEVLKKLGARYGAQYLITEREPEVALPLLYRNGSFAVYRL